MDFKLFVAVFCLASIQVSEAVVAWSALTGTATISECVQTGTSVSYTQTATPTGPATVASYALTHTPTTGTAVFAVSSTGVLTTLTTAASKLAAATTASYAVVITVTDSTDATSILTLTVSVTTCPSSASFVFPSLAVMLISLVSLLMKNNN